MRVPLWTCLALAAAACGSAAPPTSTVATSSAALQRGLGRSRRTTLDRRQHEGRLAYGVSAGEAIARLIFGPHAARVRTVGVD